MAKFTLHMNSPLQLAVAGLPPNTPYQCPLHCIALMVVMMIMMVMMMMMTFTGEIEIMEAISSDRMPWACSQPCNGGHADDDGDPDNGDPDDSDHDAIDENREI